MRKGFGGFFFFLLVLALGNQLDGLLGQCGGCIYTRSIYACPALALGYDAVFSTGSFCFTLAEIKLSNKAGLSQPIRNGRVNNDQRQPGQKNDK